jgi:hypothetical protein
MIRFPAAAEAPATVSFTTSLSVLATGTNSPLKQAGAPRFPIFYLADSLYHETNLWNDAIGQAVRLFRGREYGVGQPRDLGTAVADIISRALDAKKIRPANADAIEQQYPH